MRLCATIVPSLTITAAFRVDLSGEGVEGTGLLREEERTSLVQETIGIMPSFIPEQLPVLPLHWFLMG